MNLASKFPATPRNTSEGTPDYRLAATMFWPRHAPLIYDARDAINARIYNGELPDLAILVGLTPHARSVGYCEMRNPPVITLHPSLLTPRTANPWGEAAEHLNAAFLVDVLTHEMIHAWHAIHPPGAYPDWCSGPHSDDQEVHNNPHWCTEIMRQSPLVGIAEIIASPWRRARQSKALGGRLEYQPVLPNSVTRKAAAAWPYSIRPVGYYDSDTPWFDRELFPATSRNTTGNHVHELGVTG